MNNKFVPIGIVIIIIAGFFAKGQLVAIRDKNAQLKAYDVQTTEAQSKIQALRDLKPKLDAAQAQVNALKVAMPAAQQIPEVLVMMEAIAAKAGMKITSVDVSPTTAGSGNEVGVNMSAQGTYAGLFNFSQVLEKNVRPIQIHSMSISRSGQGDAISASVSLGVLYQGTVQQQVASSN